MVFLLDDDYGFPDPHLGEPDGLLAIGGDLSPQRLLDAYTHGIFPWYAYRDTDLPDVYINQATGRPHVRWWCPMERFVIFPDEVHVSHSMRQVMRRVARGEYLVTFNQAFGQVIAQCGGLRDAEEGAWLGPEMMAAYTELHRMGYALSIEVWQHTSPGPGARPAPTADASPSVATSAEAPSSETGPIDTTAGRTSADVSTMESPAGKPSSGVSTTEGIAGAPSSGACTTERHADEPSSGGSTTEGPAGEPSAGACTMEVPIDAPSAYESAQGTADDGADGVASLRLVGGLYGVTIGRGFFGESMFSLVPNGSKIALIALADLCRTAGVRLIDCQFETPHLRSMGGRYISYDTYLDLIGDAPET